MPKCVYAEHYYKNMFSHNTPIVLDFCRERKDSLSEKEFIDKAIFLSEKEEFSLNILENDTRISADFVAGKLFLSCEGTALFEELVQLSDMIEIIVPQKNTTNITIRLGRKKQN